MKILILLLSFSTLIFAASAKRTVSFVCNECHGERMDESGMGVSKAPISLSQSEILTALKGYKSARRSEYGMGNTMTVVLSDYNDNDLNDLSKYIPTLK
ncbi:MAG: hypothetical protein L3J19_01420 [Sulfurimonas sp.]|nr:hypothetical protein [Sulfurimonas sp.]